MKGKCKNTKDKIFKKYLKENGIGETGDTFHAIGVKYIYAYYSLFALLGVIWHTDGKEIVYDKVVIRNIKSTGKTEVIDFRNKTIKEVEFKEIRKYDGMKTKELEKMGII